jgi:hypothetical protein
VNSRVIDGVRVTTNKHSSSLIQLVAIRADSWFLAPTRIELEASRTCRGSQRMSVDAFDRSVSVTTAFFLLALPAVPKAIVGFGRR